MKISNYSLRARYFPAIINTIPFIIIGLSVTNQHLIELFENLLGIKIISEISMSLIIIYAIAQLQRIFSKEIFENTIFNNGLNFPTTLYLLYSDNTYSLDYKQKIREKIFSDFNIHLPNEKVEIDYSRSACQKIAEAVSLVRRKVGNGTLTLQHNIEYGFIRNLVGGSILGLIGSLAILILNRFDLVNDSANIIAWVLMCIYILILIFSKVLLKRYARLYANILFQDYVTIK